MQIFSPADRAMAKDIYEDFENAVKANGGFEELQKRTG